MCVDFATVRPLVDSRRLKGAHGKYSREVVARFCLTLFLFSLSPNASKGREGKIQMDGEREFQNGGRGNRD